VLGSDRQDRVHMLVTTMRVIGTEYCPTIIR
jgi:hypothetical protein